MKLWSMKSSMMQQVNQLQNNRSVFQMVVAFVVPKTGPIHLVLVGLMAGSRPAGRQSDESLVVLKKIKKLPYNANRSWWKTFTFACSSCYSRENFCVSVACAICGKIRHHITIVNLQCYVQKRSAIHVLSRWQRSWTMEELEADSCVRGLYVYQDNCIDTSLLASWMVALSTFALNGPIRLGSGIWQEPFLHDLRAKLRKMRKFSTANDLHYMI